MPRCDDAQTYITCLKREWESRSHEIDANPRTIYLGGGTPSSLTIAQLTEIIKFLPTTNVEEFTIEVNPEDVSEDFAKFIATSPINRVSMGVQSLIDSELKAVGRRHTAADAVKAVDLLQNAGINNISLDLIFGLPVQNIDSWIHSVEGVLALNPQHLSAYSLMLEQGTRLWAQVQAGKLNETTQELSEEMYNILCKAATDAGMEHYEISNFAKPGYRSLHNSSYWNLTPYLGLGVAAHSFDGKIRRYNPSNLRLYTQKQPCYEEESTTTTDRVNEYLLIRLRTTEGLDLTQYKYLFGTNETNRMLKQAQRHLVTGFLIRENDRLWIPESHWLTSDPIIMDLFCDGD